MEGKYLDPKADDSIWDAVYRERVFYDDGFKKGKMEGRDEGRAEERLVNARNLKANNVPLDIIIKSLNLTKEEIEQL